MLYELRTYTVRPGRLDAYLARFEQRGLPVISRYAELVGYWTVDVGPLNQVVHIWRYEDAAQRADRRHRLYQDPEWTGDYLPASVGDLISQESRLLKPADFSPLA